VAEIEIGLDSQLHELLQEVARKKGMDPEELSGKLVREKLRERTMPPVNPGKVTPFRRGPTKDLNRIRGPD